MNADTWIALVCTLIVAGVLGLGWASGGGA